MGTQSEIVFACYSKACAPPPAGKGGSSKGGKKGAGSAAERDAFHKAALDKVKKEFAGKRRNVTYKTHDMKDRPGTEGPKVSRYYKGGRK